ncbi:MAG: hypothetical protein MUC96_15970 [Myxococcaceae bacterium]|jgi:uncharacterized protein involved in exopolysaccharide biosynthesis|nr:hypothetical protein [Myxococcaceae bacterium]
MHHLLLAALLSASPDAAMKGRFVSKGSVVFDAATISLEQEPAEVADILMATEAGVVLSDNVLFVFEKALDSVAGMPKEPNKRYALIRQATTVKRRGSSLILDIEVSFDDPQVSKFVCGKLLTSYIEERLERRAVTSERRLRLIDEELKKAKGPRADQLKDERAREERKLRDRFNELRLLEACTEP